MTQSRRLYSVHFPPLGVGIDPVSVVCVLVNVVVGAVVIVSVVPVPLTLSVYTTYSMVIFFK
jgi:hypothetical protein